jgi:hypothetical protein
MKRAAVVAATAAGILSLSCASGAAFAAAPSAEPIPTVNFCAMHSATLGTFHSEPADRLVSEVLTGRPGTERDIVPPFAYNGNSYSQNWDGHGEAIFTTHCIKAENGVLGATHTSSQAMVDRTSGTLPFWIPALLATVLVSAGFACRRSSGRKGGGGRT